MSSFVPCARPLAILVLITAAALLFFYRLEAPLLEPEEAVYAEVPREMAVAGNWVVPVRHGQNYYEKPPLLYWLIMASYSVFGVHDWAARLVPGLSALGTVLITFWWGNRMFGFRAGLAGAMVLCLSPRFVHHARMVTMDGLLCFWVTTALAFGQQALQGGMKRPYWFLSAAACGLGLLTKGPVAIILIGAPLLLCRLPPLATRHSPLMWRPGFKGWLIYLGVAAAVSVPWYAAITWQDPDFLREFFLTHHVLMRFVQPLHDEPWWFYVPSLLAGMLPWTLLLPWLRWNRKDQRTSGQVKFLLVCCIWSVLFFSAAECKRINYILPAMPALALALGFVLDRRLECGGTRLPFWTTQGVFAGGIIGSLLATRIDLLPPDACAVLVTLSLAGMAWMLRRRHRQTPAVAWAACGLATFGLLLLTLQFLLPAYYHRFSMRDQLQTLGADGRLPIACYPHHWDSIGFYLQREDIDSYNRDARERMIDHLERRSPTLVFVKTGRALGELLQTLPAGLEFVTHGQSRTVTAGIVRQR